MAAAFSPRSVFITGASSGIGEALAVRLAGPGVRLALSGRNSERLEAVAERCRAGGATVDARTIDVADRAAMATWIGEIEAGRPLDLVVANAGISAGPGGGIEDEAQVRDIFAVNVIGLLNTVLPVVPSMAARGRGRIALVSSLAGFRGFPSAPAYSASKAAVKAYGEALRGTLRPRGVGVSVVCPGFVESRITAKNDFPMPALMSAEAAAAVIVRGLARDKGLIAFPWWIALGVRSLDFLPVALVERVLSRLPKKG